MNCNHETQHLVGTSEGIKCRLCGKLFKTYEELEKDRTPVEEPKTEPIEEVAEEKPEAEKPKSKGGRGRKAAK